MAHQLSKHPGIDHAGRRKAVSGLLDGVAADTIVSAAAAAVAGAAAIAEAPDTLAATIGEVIVVEPTPAGDGGRRRRKGRRARLKDQDLTRVEDQDQLYQYAEPEKPKAPDVRPEKALVAVEPKPVKPERKPVNRANLMKAVAVAMLMLEDL